MLTTTCSVSKHLTNRCPLEFGAAKRTGRYTLHGTKWKNRLLHYKLYLMCNIRRKLETESHAPETLARTVEFWSVEKDSIDQVGFQCRPITRYIIGRKAENI